MRFSHIIIPLLATAATAAPVAEDDGPRTPVGMDRNEVNKCKSWLWAVGILVPPIGLYQGGRCIDWLLDVRKAKKQQGKQGEAHKEKYIEFSDSDSDSDNDCYVDECEERGDKCAEYCEDDKCVPVCGQPVPREGKTTSVQPPKSTSSVVDLATHSMQHERKPKPSPTTTGVVVEEENVFVYTSIPHKTPEPTATVVVVEEDEVVVHTSVEVEPAKATAQ